MASGEGWRELVSRSRPRRATSAAAEATGEKWRGDGDCKEMVVAAMRLWRRRRDGGGGDDSGDDDGDDLEGVGEDDGEEFINVS